MPVLHKRSDWADTAACRHVDTAAFIPSAGGRPTSMAFRLCGQCPVQIECLEYALTFRAVGLWGGTSPEDRRALLRARDEQGSCAEWTFGCGCAYCDLVSTLTQHRGRVRNRNTTTAQCGKISTYSRGCRCSACRYAMHRREWGRRRIHKAPAGAAQTRLWRTDKCVHGRMCRPCEYQTA